MARPAMIEKVTKKLANVGVSQVTLGIVTDWLAWELLGSMWICTAVETCWRRVDSVKGIIGAMAARNPFTYDRDNLERDTEFGFGAGMFPDPNIDYTEGGAISRIPIADPDSTAQLLQLAMIKRMDLADSTDQPSPYVAGNTDRFGAQPPLVRERKRPKYTRPERPKRARMERSW